MGGPLTTSKFATVLDHFGLRGPVGPVGPVGRRWTLTTILDFILNGPFWTSYFMDRCTSGPPYASDGRMLGWKWCTCRRVLHNCVTSSILSRVSFITLHNSIHKNHSRLLLQLWHIDAAEVFTLFHLASYYNYDWQCHRNLEGAWRVPECVGTTQEWQSITK